VSEPRRVVPLSGPPTSRSSTEQARFADEPRDAQDLPSA
jgi:hypothetical protein